MIELQQIKDQQDNEIQHKTNNKSLEIENIKNAFQLMHQRVEADLASATRENNRLTDQMQKKEKEISDLNVIIKEQEKILSEKVNVTKTELHKSN